MNAPVKTKRTAGRPAAFSREEALECAIKTFWKHGYEGADLAQIAAALGATKPSLYRQFGCKKQLFIAATQHYIAKINTAPRQSLYRSKHIRQSLADLLEFSVSAYTRPNEPQGCFLSCIATAMAEDHPEVGKLFLKATRILETCIAERMQQAIADKELPRHFPVAKRAQLMANLMNAVSLRARAGASRKSLLADSDDMIGYILA